MSDTVKFAITEYGPAVQEAWDAVEEHPQAEWVEMVCKSDVVLSEYEIGYGRVWISDEESYDFECGDDVGVLLSDVIHRFKTM